MTRSSLFLLASLLAACAQEPTPSTPDAAAADAPVLDASSAAAPDVTPDAAAPDVTPDAAAPDVTPDAAAPDVTPDAAAPDAAVASFASIYERILRPRCAACHGDASRTSSFAMHDAPTAWRNLVDVPVRSQWISTCTSLWNPPVMRTWRVRPGDPDLSMLHFLSRCYVRDAQHDALTADERETLRAWIAAGAPAGAL